MIVADKDAPRTLSLLRPSDGGTAGVVPLPGGASVYRDPGGGFYVHAFFGQLVAYNAAGTERWRLPEASPANALYYEDFLVLFGDERLVLLEREGGRRLGELRGSFGVKPGSSLRNGILLYRVEDNGKKVGQAIFVRVRGAKG